MASLSQNSISPSLRKSRWACALATVLAPGWALANPTGAQVVAGTVGLGSSGASTLVVNQTSNSAIINWQQFSIGGQEYVVFNQPSAAAAVLNRVIGGSPSEILGHLSSNGRVFLINPMGVMFGAGSRIDVGGLVASTLDIANTDFMSGRYVFAGSSTGAVSNAGRITAAPGGFVVLAGDKVQNSGLIQAQIGDVVLASGSAVTLNADPAGLVSFAIDRTALSDAAGVSNVGDIVASGGAVLMTAHTARTLAGSAVNNSGRVSAQSIQDHAGSIVLSAEGGNVVDSGTLDASGAGGAAGGTIRLLADRDVTLTGTSITFAGGSGGGDVRAIAGRTLDYQHGARMDVSAQSLTGRGGFAELSGHDRVSIHDIVTLGRHGHLFIDPLTDVTIGAGGDYDEATLERQLQQTAEGQQVTIAASGSITLLDLADNFLDGSNSTAGLGAGLSLQGGNITFVDTNDTIKVDGDLSLSTCSCEAVVAGGLDSVLGSVTIDAGSVDVRNDIVAGTDVSMSVGGGSISAGNISAGGAITLSVSGGQIALGTTQSPASLVSGGTTSIVLSGNDAATNGISLNGTIFSAGDINLLALGATYGIDAGGTIAGAGLVTVQSDGAINIADVLVTERAGFASMLISGNADVITGSLSAIASGGGAGIQVHSVNAIDVRGGILVDGGGATLGSTSFAQAASLSLQASGLVNVNNQVSVTGHAFNLSNSFSLTATETGTDGSTSASISGQSVSIGGGLSVSGVGNTNVSVFGTGNVTLTGGVSVISAARTRNFTDTSTGETQVERSGIASFQTSSGGTFSSDGMQVIGPNASVNINANFVRLNRDAAGNALVVDALAGGPGATQGAYYLDSINGTPVIESTYGAASAIVTANLGNTSTTSLAADGLVSVVGPSAFLHLGGPGLILVGDDVNGGNIEIGGTGYRISGNWSSLPFNHSPGGSTGGQFASPVSPFGAVGAGNVPILSNGTLVWGDARLEVNDDGFAGGGGFAPVARFTVFGDILVSGIGRSDAQIVANGMDVIGLFNPFSGVFIDALGQGPAQIQGTLAPSFVDINGVTYQVTRQVSDGAGGAATFGNASFQFTAIAPLADLNLPSLLVQGLSAQAEFSGGNHLTFDTLEVFGTDGAGTARYVDQSTFVPLQTGGPAIGPTATTIVGGQNVISFGFQGTAPAAVSANRITVSGDGVAALVGGARGQFSGGDITVFAGAGQFTSDDPTVDFQPIDSGGDAVLSLQSTGQVQATSISVDAVDAVHIGGNYSDSGDFHAASGGAMDQVLPAVLPAFHHPLMPGGSAPTASPDIPLPRLQVSATNIDLAFGDGSLINSAVLTAELALSLTGGTLNAGNVSWSADTVDITGVQFSAGAFAIAASSSLTMSGASINASSIDLSAGTVHASNGNLAAQGLLQIDATGSLQLSGVGINAGLTAPQTGRSVSLIAGTDLSFGGTLVGDQVNLSAGHGAGATTGAMNLGGAIRANYTNLGAAGVLTAVAPLQVDSGALDASGQRIDFQQATLRIGNGIAVNGHDSIMLGRIPSSLLPLTAGPNAAFVSPGSVTIGSLSMSSGYLFVRAHDAALTSLTTNGNFFYNFRPFGDTDFIPLATLPNFRSPPGTVTFAFGGTGYGGDIRFDTAGLQQKLVGSENYILFTGGNIIGLDTVHTTGQVVVLGGVVVVPPPPPPPPPPPTAGGDAQTEATDAQLATTNMSGTGTINQGSSIETAYNEGQNGELSPNPSLVDEQSSSSTAGDLQCR